MKKAVLGIMFGITAAKIASTTVCAEELKEPKPIYKRGLDASVQIAGSVGSVDMRYKRDSLPGLEKKSKDWSAAGWIGA
jgi:hypothetical protein